jgi:hypothetical protein
MTPFGSRARRAAGGIRRLRRRLGGDRRAEISERQAGCAGFGLGGRAARRPFAERGDISLGFRSFPFLRDAPDFVQDFGHRAARANQLVENPLDPFLIVGADAIAQLVVETRDVNSRGYAWHGGALTRSSLSSVSPIPGSIFGLRFLIQLAPAWSSQSSAFIAFSPFPIA